MKEALEILTLGAGASFQDEGRPGWKRFGLPPAGAMDAESARMANGLVGNERSAPVVELLLGRASFRALRPVELAVTGAAVAMNYPLWRSFRLEPGDVLTIGFPAQGLWSYLAIAGGFAAPHYFGSASTHRRAGLGAVPHAGDRLMTGAENHESTRIAARFMPEGSRPPIGDPPPLVFWPGPEWEGLSAETRERFLQGEWRVSSQSDRMGYRLEGPSLTEGFREIMSGPVPVGTVQLPASGRPIVLMRDGPTVGGYPRIGLIEEPSLSTFSQCAPGQAIRFQLADGYQL